MCVLVVCVLVVFDISLDTLEARDGLFVIHCSSKAVKADVKSAYRCKEKENKKVSGYKTLVSFEVFLLNIVEI